MSTTMKRAQVLFAYLSPTAPTLNAVTVLPEVGMIGSEFTAFSGVSGNPTPDLSYQWKLDTVNVGTDSPSYTPVSSGSLTCEVTATNASGSDVLESAPASVTSETSPNPFTVTQWSTQSNGSVAGDEIVIIVSVLPYDGGSPITDLQYRIDGGAWMSLGGTSLGSYVVGGLVNGVQVSVTIRAINAIDPDPSNPSDAKLVIPDQASFEPLISVANASFTINTGDQSIPVVNTGGDIDTLDLLPAALIAPAAQTVTEGSVTSVNAQAWFTPRTANGAFSISAGLEIDATTGIIDATNSTPTAEATYTVTLTGEVGDTPATVDVDITIESSVDPGSWDATAGENEIVVNAVPIVNAPVATAGENEIVVTG